MTSSFLRRIFSFCLHSQPKAQQYSRNICIVPIDKSIVPMNIYHEKCDIWNCAQFYVNSNDWIIESYSTSMNSSCWMFNLKLLVFTLLSIRRINCEKYISINKLEVLAIVRVNEADGKNENRSTIVQMLVEKCAI